MIAGITVAIMVVIVVMIVVTLVVMVVVMVVVIVVVIVAVMKVVMIVITIVAMMCIRIVVMIVVVSEPAAENPQGTQTQACSHSPSQVRAPNPRVRRTLGTRASSGAMVTLGSLAMALELAGSGSGDLYEHACVCWLAHH